MSGQTTISSDDSDSTAQLLCAVGMSLGLVVVGDPQSIGPAVIATSASLKELSADSYAVWVGAQDPRGRADLIRWACEQGASDPEPQLTELLEAGLVAALPSPSEITDWSKRFRLIPQGVGIGNGAQVDANFIIGDRSGNPVMAVDIGTYYVWGLSASAHSLSAALEATVKSTDIPLDWLRDRVAAVLPVLLRAQAVYLDAA